MVRNLLRVLVFYMVVIPALAVAAFAEDQPANRAIQEEVWAIPVTLPTIAYVVRPVGKGPFPLVVMNHGVSLNPQERSLFPLVEFRDAAMWFARKGYMVVAPTGSGYGAAALDVPERGLYGTFYSKIGRCDNPNFRDAGLAVALLDKWIIDYMAEQKLIVPDNVVVVGQSAGGWAGIALSSRNLPSVRAIITFAAGRGGRVGGKPNNNCALPALLAQLMYGSPGPTYAQQPSQTNSPQANEKPPGQEFAPRGQRMAREIKYSDWRKFCFKMPGTNMVCRTTISGTFETGQSAVRIDLIEREGEGAARLQLFLPVGLYLQAGVKITVDQGTPYLIPYVWCLTNTCIAADRVDPKLRKEMESGQKLLLEVVDSSVLTVSTSVPLDQFAAVRQGTPTQIVEQAIDG